jgi:3-phenylpropionate/trans-cinnamate dioxygenase ferredoxin component
MTLITKSPAYQIVCAENDLAVGKARRIIVENTPVAVFHAEDGFYAIEDTCSHQAGSLAFGDLQGSVVACPRHGALFDIKTGETLSLPAVRGVRSYPVKIEGGQVFVGIRPKDEAIPELLRLG